MLRIFSKKKKSFKTKVFDTRHLETVFNTFTDTRQCPWCELNGKVQDQGQFYVAEIICKNVFIILYKTVYKKIKLHKKGKKCQ